MNIFIKFKEKKKLITIKEENTNITILNLIEQIKNEITPKDEIKIDIKNWDIKLTFQKKELLKEKKLIEYNIQNSDDLEAEIIEKDVFSYSLVEEKQFLCNFCFSILNNPIQLNCNHFYCESCFNYLKTIQNIDKNPEEDQLNKFKIEEKKDKNSICCLICNSNNEKKENNLNQLKLKIENYFKEKKKVDIINCEGGTEEEPCSNIASIRCEKCEMNLCEECSIKLHKIGKNKLHKQEKIISKSILILIFFFFLIFFFNFFFSFF
jgi:hypothetical protein